MSLLKKLYRWWMVFAHAFGIVNSLIILTVLYYTLFGFYALCFKVARFVRYMRHGVSERKTSFWLEKKYEAPSVNLLKRQF